jgi:ADP-ribosylglycohydrolase
MRTSYVGILRPWDLDWTEAVAVEMAKVTHFDPRCVAGAVALSVAIATLIDTDGDVQEAFQQACTRADKYDPVAHTWILDRSLASLELDEDMDKPRGNSFPPIGFTYKCLGAAFWALREFQRLPEGDASTNRFLDVLRAVIRAGGDADTNGAVAGAMLGALVGASGIPNHLITGLVERAGLDRRFERLSVG